ncbi:hypothetical protein [Bacillus atrophaeus]|nr:hypothetical protein [Bacillus atrophaeus]
MGTMTGDLAGLIGANGAGREAIRTEINARASSISSLQIPCVF